MARFIDAEPRYIDANSLKQKWLFLGKDGKPYRDEIDAQPTADVAPVVHGEWKPNNLNGFKIYDCSNCGVHMEAKFNYCPFCGARMDGGK